MAVRLVLLALASAALATPLDDYVNKPDPHYSWVELPEYEFKGPGYTGHVLNMTSQQWLTSADSDRSIWWHYMAVIVPDEIEFHTQAELWITGNGNLDAPPNGKGEDEELVAALAVGNKIVTAALFQVPNAPIVFATDPLQQSRVEDAIIAFTWHHFFLNTSEPEWLLRLPMTKAAVRAMDTIDAFMQSKGGKPVTEFIVAGASKRGWTTWTTGAVDKRVIAICPIVMDLLNMHQNLHHMYRAFGGWTFAFQDYYVMNFTQDIDWPQLQEMAAIIDPYSYRDRLTMPKLVIDAGGDEFFMLDDNWAWWDDMQGEMHLRMIQDAEHSLATGIPEALESVLSFSRGVLTNSPRPITTWTMERSNTSGTTTVYCSEPPVEVEVWHADTLNHSRRDWRLVVGDNPCPYVPVKGDCIAPVLWHRTTAKQLNATTFSASFDIPEDGGWRAFFITTKFKSPMVANYQFTTQVNIIPDYYPFPDCSGAACKGVLL